jgi:NADPH:quinone reductase
VLEENAVEVPADLDPAEVVSLVLTYMTAYQLLHRTAEVKHGETVLVHGAAGRVGTAVLELGALAGVRLLWDLFGSRPCCGRAARRGGNRLPTGGLPDPGAGAPRKRRRRRARWARRQDLAALLPRAAARRKARRVRPLRHARARTQELARVGRVVRGDRDRRALGPALAPPAGVGLPDPEATRGPPACSHGEPPTASRGGPRVPEWFREDFRALLGLLREGQIHPVVAERLPLADARRAHELLESSAAKGKLVLVP